MRKETVLVASPSAIGKTPVASGSSVPAWPAFWASNARRTRPTACVEPNPSGLSSATQPETGRPLRRRAIVWVEVLRHLRVVQQPLDALGLGEALVVHEL